MSIKFLSIIKYFLKVILTLVLLFQWTLPIIDKKKNLHINFSDITFEKCNDPNHSHPPLTQRDTPDDAEKLTNSDRSILRTIVNRKCAPIAPRTTFGLNASAHSLDKAMFLTPNHAADRNRVPTFPGSESLSR